MPHGPGHCSPIALGRRARPTFGTRQARNVTLNALHDRNEVLFYRLLTGQLSEMLPIVYTPTVGQAIEHYSGEYRRPRGIYLSVDHPELIEASLLACDLGPDEADLIVATDAGAILGIGDWGVGGIDIAVGKLAVYTAAGGIDPARTIPVMLDVGTDRHGLHLVQYPPAAQGAQRGGNRAEAARRRRVRQLFEHIRRASTQHHQVGDFLDVERLDVAYRLPVLGRLDHLAFGRPLSRLQLDRDVPGQGFHRGGDHRHAGLGDNAELGLAAWILERLDPVDQPADRLALGHQHEHRDEEHGNRPGEIAGQQHGRFVHASSLAGSGAQLKTQPSNRSSDSGNAAEVQRLGEHSAVLERSGPAGGEGGG